MRQRRFQPFLLLLAFTAAIQLPSKTGAADSAKPAEFPQGTWTLELTGSYADHIRFSEDRFAFGTVGANYYLWDNLSLGVHLSGYSVDQPHDDGYGVGVEAFGRLHFLTLDRFTLYFDGGGGKGYFDPETPEFGTHWNYSAKVGFGLTYRINDDAWLMGGARYFHVSNGDQFGRENNPSYDGIQYYAGVMIKL